MADTVPSTATRFRVLGIWMLALGLILGLGAFAILQLSQDKIESARLNLGPDEYAGTVTRFWVCTGVGLAVAAVGAILLFLSPQPNAIPQVVVDRASATSSIEDRLATVRLLLDQGAISDDEYQHQRKRILDQT